MPEIIGRGPGRRLVALAGALALGAAACGGSTETAVDIAAPSSSTADTTTGAAGGTGSTAGSSETSAGENLFPDIEVVNVADSSTLSLSQELAGGDLPVLLWFWAPH